MLQVGHRNLNSLVRHTWVLPGSWNLVQRLVAQLTLTGGGKGTTWWAVLKLPVGPLQGGPVLVNRVNRLLCRLSLGLLPLGRILWGLMSQAPKLEKLYQEAMPSPWERKHQYVLNCYSFRCEN